MATDNEKLEPQHLGDGVYIHDEKYVLVLAVNHHDNRVVYMGENEVLGFIRYALKSGIIKKEDI